MIPVEIQENSPRFQNFVVEESNEERKVNLDLLHEVREEQGETSAVSGRRLGDAKSPPVPARRQVVSQVIHQDRR